MQFRSVAAVSITYAVMSRCGLEPEQVLDHEDFMAVFDFNTLATVAALGTEHEKIAERSLNNEQHAVIHEERGLSDSQPESFGFSIHDYFFAKTLSPDMDWRKSLPKMGGSITARIISQIRRAVEYMNCLVAISRESAIGHPGL